MTRAGILIGLGCLLAACEGRELAIFDISVGAPNGGSTSAGGTGGTDDTSGTTSSSGGAEAGSAGAASTAGQVTAGGGGGGTMFTEGEGGDASSSAGGSGGCTQDLDCGSGWVCEKQGCDATVGFCVPWPALCPNDPRPVCGCDGVTYWNDCIRLSSPGHAPLAAFDQCRATADTCGTGSDCNVPYASCSHLMAPGQLCGQGVGSCWVLPPQCTPSADKKLWLQCKPPDQGQPPPFCVDTCLAIRSERPHAELRRGDTCN